MQTKQSFKDNKESLLQHFVSRAHVTGFAKMQSRALKLRPQSAPRGNAFVGPAKV